MLQRQYKIIKALSDELRCLNKAWFTRSVKIYSFSVFFFWLFSTKAERKKLQRSARCVNQAKILGGEFFFSFV